MRNRLTKADVEGLLAALDGPVDALGCAVGRAVEVLHGTDDVGAVLERLGRGSLAERVTAGDEAALWEVATELNELRRLEPGGRQPPR